MKIAVIGATGRVGSLVAEEALKRGHEVTGIVIDPENIKNSAIKVVEKSIFDLTKEDLQNYEVVVSAFGQFNPSLVFQHQTAMMSLINALKDLPNTRLLVVGGAASLFTDETMEHRVLESIPEKFRGVPSNMFEAFKNLQTSTVNWTYFSPAYTFDPQGTKTGSYKLGTDFLFNNDEGESYISYADYAIAMVDEIENKQFVGKRFTAVSNKNGAPAAEEPSGKEFPDLVFEGNLSHYRGPRVLELAGKSFYLVMDDGTEGTLSFVTGETLMWAPVGGYAMTEKYDCAKIDEDTYLVVYEITGSEPRKGVTLILDLEQGLVTDIQAFQRFNKSFPQLVSNNIVFGAIKEDGKPLPAKRHGFTSDLVGSRIVWKYYPLQQGIAHVYFDANYIRLPFVTDKNATPENGKHPYDETAKYIKIKKNIYAVSFLEDHSTFKGGLGNNMLVVLDIARLRNVGRSFGTHHSDRTPENYIFTAYGKWQDSEEMDFSPSMYRV